MKRLIALIIAASTIGAAAQTTNTTPGSFFNTLTSYFTSFNPTLTNTFQAKTTLWTGIDSIQGGTASLVNEIGLSYNIYGPISIEEVTRDGGVAGTLVSQSIGLGLNFTVVDTRLTVYADGCYQLDSPTGTKTLDNINAEAGLRVQKALTEHTFAWIGLGVKFPKQEHVFEGGVGFTF